MMKAPPKCKIPHTADEAKSLAKSASKRGKRIGSSLAQSLSRKGFEKGRILDAGCGSGEIAIKLADAFFQAEVVGIDLSDPLLEMARQSAEGIENVKFEKADVEAMPFPDDSFDIVVSMNMLRIVDHPVTMLNEIERVLSPDGVLGLGDLKRSWVGYLMPVLKTGYTAEEAKEILRKSNLRSWDFTESHFWFSLTAGTLAQ